MIGLFAAAALKTFCAPRAGAFLRACGEPEVAQRAALARILKNSTGSAYARSLGLQAGDDIGRFRARTPIVDYEAVASWIERQRHGERQAFTGAKPVCYEPTSGSSGAAKRIPYTAALLSSFQSLFRIWAYDLLSHRLRPRSGRLFISVSPRFSPVSRADGKDQAFTDDSEYLGAMLRAVLGRFLVVAQGARLPREPEHFRDVVSCTLAAEAQLEMISIWSPSYLLVLLEHLAQHRGRLLPALRQGRIERDGQVYRFPRVEGERLWQFEQERIDWPRMWPLLQLVSCWASAASAAPARRLQQLLPGIFLQPKGLLATEAPITVPLLAADGCVPLLDEVMLEFDDGARQHLLHELEIGAQYDIIVTQAGGLLRYRLGDRVRVSGFFRGVPTLEFLGRANAVADLVGEKLHEGFVQSALTSLGYCNGPALLLPMAEEGERPHYRLLLDADATLAARQVDSALAAQRVDTELQAAHHYRLARQLGQLDPVRVYQVPELGRQVQNFFLQRGHKMGDIKDRCLVTSPELAQALWNCTTTDYPRSAT